VEPGFVDNNFRRILYLFLKIFLNKFEANLNTVNLTSFFVNALATAGAKNPGKLAIVFVIPNRVPANSGAIST
jgi:hypothetical protein